MSTGRGGNQDAFGMTLDSGWDCTGDRLEFLKEMDKLRIKLGRVPTVLEGFRVAVGMGWAKGPPGWSPPPSESEVTKVVRTVRREVPTDPDELKKVVLSIVASRPSISGSDIIDKFRGGGRGRSNVYLRTKATVEPVLLVLESVGLIARVKSPYLRHGTRWRLV